MQNSSSAHHPASATQIKCSLDVHQRASKIPFRALKIPKRALKTPWKWALKIPFRAVKIPKRALKTPCKWALKIPFRALKIPERALKTPFKWALKIPFRAVEILKQAIKIENNATKIQAARTIIAVTPNTTLKPSCRLAPGPDHRGAQQQEHPARLPLSR